jgi:transposase
MRGSDLHQADLISYVNWEERVAKTHPLRKLREIVNDLLKEMNSEFAAMYKHTGRPSIPPERLLRALLWQIFYSVRSERMLMEQLDYNLLFRWFVGLEMDEPVWNHAVFSKNRERLLNEEVARSFFTHVTELARDYMSDEHFTVDGTLIEAWASQKSFQPKDGSGDGDGTNFHGEQRKNDTHESKTDPEARLYKKSHGQEAKLSYLGHIVIENRNGLIREVAGTQAHGQAEVEAALSMAERIAKPGQRITLAADKAYDRKDFVKTVRGLGVTPHVTQNNKGRRSAIDARTTRHEGYRISLSKRWLVEKAFGWRKQTGGLKKSKLRGLDKVEWLVTFTAAAYNLLRIKTLQEQCV